MVLRKKRPVINKRGSKTRKKKKNIPPGNRSRIGERFRLNGNRR